MPTIISRYFVHRDTYLAVLTLYIQDTRFQVYCTNMQHMHTNYIQANIVRSTVGPGSEYTWKLP